MIIEFQKIEWKQNWLDDYLKWVYGFVNAVRDTIYIGKMMMLWLRILN